MNKTSNITIRIDDELKKDTESTLKKLGLNFTEAITIYLNQIRLTQSIPFKLEIPKFSDEMLEALEEAEKMKEHPENYKKYNSAAELLEDIENGE